MLSRLVTKKVGVLDTNHGYAMTQVVNSEVAKQRTALQQRLATLERKREAAHQES